MYRFLNFKTRFKFTVAYSLLFGRGQGLLDPMANGRSEILPIFSDKFEKAETIISTEKFTCYSVLYALMSCGLCCVSGCFMKTVRVL